MVDSVELYQRLMKGCHIRELSVGSLRWAYMDWCGNHTYHVDQVLPCRVYIDLNRRDSRI
jgi:hypothetical protein